jgi:hypothetical protein
MMCNNLNVLFFQSLLNNLFLIIKIKVRDNNYYNVIKYYTVTDLKIKNFIRNGDHRPKRNAPSVQQGVNPLTL